MKKHIFISKKYFRCFTEPAKVCVDKAFYKMTLSKNHLENISIL